MTQDDAKRKKPKSQAKSARNQNILIDAAKGAKPKELQEKYKLSREQVSRILNSDEMKAIVKKGESKIHELLDMSLKVIEMALNSADEKLAADIAVRIAKSVGALKDKVDISHSYPKPTIIHDTKAGTKVILGTKEEGEE